MAARYPTHVTVLPLLLAIVIAATTIGTAEGIRFDQAMQGFSAKLDPLVLSAAGILKPKAGPPRAQVFIYPPVRFIVDPSSKAALNPEKDNNAMLFTDHDVVVHGMNGADYHNSYQNLRERLGTPANKQKPLAIDAQFVRASAPVLGAVVGIFSGLGQLIADSIWSAAILFFVGPLIALVAAIGNRRLMLPRRAAYRMAAALLVPLILFNAVMYAAGYPVASVIGPDFRLYFWFLAAAMLGVWTAFMAKNMYAPASRKMPRQS